MTETEFLRKRIAELDRKAWNSNQYLFSDFLSESELSEYYEMQRELSPAGSDAFGGYEGAGRCMLRFGSEEAFGYEMPYPIACILIDPVAEKFAQEVTHRDFLGAIMNLGIERSVLGDLHVDGHSCYVFCKEEMAQYICDNLETVRHNHVKCKVLTEIPEALKPHLESGSIQIASERVDGLVAALCRLSRSKANELFASKKVFVNGRVCENRSYQMKDGDILSIRGTGKFIYRGISGNTRKGNIYVNYERYV